MGAFWDAWNKQGQVNDQAAMSQIQQASGLAGLMQQAQAQQQAQAVRGLLADSAIPLEQKIPELVKLGPVGIDTANKIAGVQRQQAQAGLLGRRNVVDTRLQDPEIWKDPDKLAPIAGAAISAGHPGGASILNYVNQMRERAAMEAFLRSRQPGGAPQEPVAPQGGAVPPQPMPQSAPVMPQSGAGTIPLGSLRTESAARAAVGQPAVGPVPAPANDPFSPAPTANDVAVARAKLADPKTPPAARAAYEDLIATANGEGPTVPTQSVDTPAPKAAAGYTRMELENMALNPNKSIRELGKRLLAEKIAEDKALNKPKPEGTWIVKEDINGPYRMNNKTGVTERINLNGAPSVNPANDPKTQRDLAAAKAGGKVEGTAAATASLDLPKVIDQTEYAIKLLDDIKADPRKRLSIGYPANLGLDKIQGSPQAGFVKRLEQIKGQQFLSAFEALKGGGQISEIEGKKATDAISAMSTAQNVKDFDAAVEEYRGVLLQGLERVKNRAALNNSGAPSAPSIQDRLNRYK
jgi:hypothetical protein